MPGNLTPMELVTRRLTLEEFFTLDEELVELVDGYPIVNPSPGFDHQRISANLLVALHQAAPEGYTVLHAPMDWILWAGALPTVRQPDLMVVRDADIERPQATRPPVLVAEILSPTSHERDLVDKRRDYARAGAPNYWIVDPTSRQILVLTLDGDEYVESQRLTGREDEVRSPFPIRLDLGQIFGVRDQ